MLCCRRGDHGADFREGADCKGPEPDRGCSARPNPRLEHLLRAKSWTTLAPPWRFRKADSSAARRAPRRPAPTHPPRSGPTMAAPGLPRLPPRAARQSQTQSAHRERYHWPPPSTTERALAPSRAPASTGEVHVETRCISTPLREDGQRRKRRRRIFSSPGLWSHPRELGPQTPSTSA